MKESIRSFIAIPLPREIQSKLSDFTMRMNLTRNNGFRPVKPENVHLTLKFLGDASPEQIKEVSAVLEKIAANQPVFNISFEGVGAFPNWSQPRVIWVGISAPSLLESLYTAIDQSTAELGFPSEGRKFSPHLTLSRVNTSISNPSFMKSIQSIQTLSPAPAFGAMQSDQVNLYRSILQSEGPTYTVISHHRFLG